MEEETTGTSGGVNHFSNALEIYAFVLQVGYQINKTFYSSTQAIQFPYNESIARAQV